MGQARKTIVRWLWRGLKWGLVVAIAGYLIYLFRFSPVPVASHRIERGEIVAEVMGTGTLEARLKVTISPKISGRIRELRADQGDRVEAGEVLVRLDDDELAQQVEISLASLAVTQAAVDRLKADRGRAMAVLAQARREHERVQRLVEQEVSTGSEFDKAVEAVAIAEAGLARAEASIVEGQQQVLAAEKTLAFQRARLTDTVIKAPFDGLIIQRQRDPGDVAVPGSRILQIVSTEQLWIRAWIDETEMARLDVGQPARVVFRSEPERSYTGKVLRLGKEADRETREFIVDVQVLELPRNWAIGQRAEVYIETARKGNVPLLNAAYVRWVDDLPGVFVSVEDRAAWRPVQLGLRSPEMIEILDGLQPGDTVIVPRDQKAGLVDGKRIEVP